MFVEVSQATSAMYLVRDLVTRTQRKYVSPLRFIVNSVYRNLIGSQVAKGIAAATPLSENYTDCLKRVSYCV